MIWRTFQRRSGELLYGEVGKPGGLVGFRMAKWKTGWPGGLFNGEAAKFGGRGLSHGEAANWGAEPLRAYKRKEKPQAVKGDETANFVTKGRRGRRRLVAGSSPNCSRNVAG